MTTDVFRVLHTADWHLGKTLHDQDRNEEHLYFLNGLDERSVKRNVFLRSLRICQYDLLYW